MSEQMLIEWLKENMTLEVDECDGVVHIALKLKSETISSVAFCAGDL